MFRLFPPTTVGGPERPLPHPRPHPLWAVAGIVVVISQWQAEQAEILLGVLAMLVVLSVTASWTTRRA